MKETAIYFVVVTSLAETMFMFMFAECDLLRSCMFSCKMKDIAV